MASRNSDHCLVILVKFGGVCSDSCKRNLMFKFEDSRMVNEGCTYIIKSAWRAKGPMDDKLDNLKQGLAKCKQQLLIWSTKIGGKAKLAAVNRKLKWVGKVQGSKDPAMARKIKEIQQEVDECLEQEDICWKQRVKAH